MRVWLQFREVGDERWEYELVDLDKLIEDNTNSDPNGVYTEIMLDTAVDWWLNDRGAMLGGDRWFGAAWEWTLVWAPPLEWFYKQEEYALKRRDEAVREHNFAQETATDYYLEAVRRGEAR